MWIFVAPVRRRIRVPRHRLRHFLGFLLVLAVLSIVIEYWKAILAVGAVVAVVWVVAAVATLRQERAAQPLDELPENYPSTSKRASPPPLLTQRRVAIRGLASEFITGLRNGRNGVSRAVLYSQLAQT